MWKSFAATFLRYGVVYAATGVLGVGVLVVVAYRARRRAALAVAASRPIDPMNAERLDAGLYEPSLPLDAGLYEPSLPLDAGPYRPSLVG